MEATQKLTRKEWIRRQVDVVLTASPLSTVKYCLDTTTQNADALEKAIPDFFLPETPVQDQSAENARLREGLAKLDESFNERIREYDDHYIKTANRVATLALNEQNLKGSLALLGEDFREAIKSRDRVLAANCKMTEEVRLLKHAVEVCGGSLQSACYHIQDLTVIAAAAREFFDANNDFEGDSTEDAVVARIANAAGELEKLLDQHGFPSPKPAPKPQVVDYLAGERTRTDPTEFEG